MFHRMTDLRAHLKWHRQIRDHECPYCERSFVTKSALQVHIRRHSGDKPYKCSYCDATFVDNNGLRRHTDSKHTNRK